MTTKRFPLEWFTHCCREELGVSIIRHGDPEPDRDGRYVDRYGDIWEWDDREEHWCITFVRHHKFAQAVSPWLAIRDHHFPLTEIYV